MVIHNVIEDIVYDSVNKLFDEAKASNEKWLTCSCLQCRLDTMCYVLNRVKPRYIKSGRGFAHFVNEEETEKSQIMADISALVVEGMHKVASIQRPHSHDGKDSKDISMSVFNFPAISGKVLNGSNFNHMDGVKVSLELDGEITPQKDVLWDNPYIISKKTPGTYIFCPSAIPSSDVDEGRKFRFLLTAEKEGFDSANVSFEIEIKSEEKEKSALECSNFYELKNLFLFETSTDAENN